MHLRILHMPAQIITQRRCHVPSQSFIILSPQISRLPTPLAVGLARARHLNLRFLVNKTFCCRCNRHRRPIRRWYDLPFQYFNRFAVASRLAYGNCPLSGDGTKDVPDDAQRGASLIPFCRTRRDKRKYSISGNTTPCFWHSFSELLKIYISILDPFRCRLLRLRPARRNIN